ncbi:hypothetical protein JCM33374_g2469 [Metschnikowia sp. JCM 33374]|nr:hypothetical protein JCM33374_g2469 [Metschnikowia sp. JCM 33374]
MFPTTLPNFIEKRYLSNKTSQFEMREIFTLVSTTTNAADGEIDSIYPAPVAVSHHSDRKVNKISGTAKPASMPLLRMVFLIMLVTSVAALSPGFSEETHPFLLKENEVDESEDVWKYGAHLESEEDLASDSNMETSSHISKFMSVEFDKLSLQDLPRFSTMDLAIDSLTEMATMGTRTMVPEVTDHLVLVDGEVVFISNFTMNHPKVLNFMRHKRWSSAESALGASWTRYRVTAQGTTWAKWSPTGCPQENKSKFPVKFELLSRWWYGATWEKGFHFGFGVKKALDLGYKVALEIRKAGTGIHTVPAKSFGQLFRQQLVVWQDQQYQKCTREAYGSAGIKCEDWSKDIRGVLPVEDAQGFGWRVGRKNMVFSGCKT